MPKLHLVGITPDHRGLVLSEHARAKRGDMVLEIDDRLLEAIEKAQRLRLRDEGHRLESNALPSKRDAVNGDNGVAGRLTPREIQARLRAGESVASLARSSGTDEAWIRRFAAPVLAEQAKILDQARGSVFSKRGVGPSAVALGPAVAANVIDRGVPLTLPDLDAAWGAFQHPAGGWHVTFSFPLRGRRQTAEWSFDLATGDLSARNKLASELGWRESGKKLPQPKPAKAAAPKRSAAAKARPARTADRSPGGAARPAGPAAPGSGAAPASPAPSGGAAVPGGAATPANAATAADAATPTRPAVADAATAAGPAPAAGGAAPAEATAGPGGKDSDGAQALPLGDEVPAAPAGEHAHPVPAPARKAPARKAAAKPAPSAAKAAPAAAKPAPKAAPAAAEPAPPAAEPVPPAAKRAAAAATETPAQSVVPVPPPPQPAGSMPPTDLDVVDVIVDLRDDETAREPAPIGGPPAPAGGPPPA